MNYYNGYLRSNHFPTTVMRISIIATALVCLFTTGNTQAQQTKKQVSQEAICNDPQVHSTLVSINENFEGQGYSLTHFETVLMPSKAILPVYIKMEQGKLYQINFVGSHDYKDLTLVIIDKDKNKLVENRLKSKNSKDHVITQNFIAPYTGNFVIAVSQKLKDGNEACGGVSILKAAK